MDGERPPGEDPPGGAWLPPEPAGPEPDLSGGGAAHPEQTTSQGWAPPAEAQPAPPPQPGYGTPPGYGAPPGQPHPGYSQQPPMAPPQQQLGWGHPPPSWPQQGWPPPPPGWAPPTHQVSSVPPNGAAVTGFVLSLTSAGLLVTSIGFLWPVTLIGAILGIVYSRKGKAAVKEGKTNKHEQLAQGGFVVGILALVFSLLAIAGCAAIVADSHLRDDFEKGLDDSNGYNSVVVLTRLLAGGLRL